MSIPVYAPCAGTLVAIEQVPDPVFSNSLVGPGVAIDPPCDTEVTVVAPVTGKVAKVHPHAFVLLSETGVGILVHLGLDTVGLAGEGFTVHVSDGEMVSQGDKMITFSPSAISEKGLNPIIPVVVMETAAEKLQITTNKNLEMGDLLLTVAE